MKSRRAGDADDTDAEGEGTDGETMRQASSTASEDFKYSDLKYSVLHGTLNPAAKATLASGWELVLLVERTCLIFISVSIHSQHLTREIMVTIWCFLMLATHVAIAPFAVKSVGVLPVSPSLFQ